jgi:quercetin dioxygenase-like cupin family protein
MVTMNPTNSPFPSVVFPADAPVVTAFGDCATFHLTGAQTGGKYTMFTSITQPGGGPPPHKHDKEDEWFLVLEGRAEFFKDGEWLEVPVGSSVFMERGTFHTFRNAGDTPLKQIIQTSPSGFEVFFTRCAAEFEKPGGPDMQKIMAISAEHGISYL